ncbi:DUF4190 domain-containing protein [Georgenia yuyongxinii]|uniref:DUF4190 domain-containing protein n=1 Tax=Georgenia yuyongxinii TaxID=2589797 RepID=A0A5B8C4M4_9MICO|nr:DUF4190 domain-containing protein [Georgenia yuyongxinii]QDC25719.1 DUF4190 domain-containing protein [Georgenia yuyongxinii]
MSENQHDQPVAPRPDPQPGPATGYGPQGPPEAQYGPPPYGYGAPPAPPAFWYSPQAEEARSAEQLALVFGILAIVAFGPVFGPLAIWQAKKAEQAGGRATAGKVLGWVGLGISIAVVVVFIVLFLMLAVGTLSANF